MKLYREKLTTCLVIFCASLCLLAMASRVYAATMRALSLEELVAKADTIVVATVAERFSRWNRHRHIVTDVVLEVQQSLKGRVSEGEQLTVTTLGGTIGEVMMKVEGSPNFVSGASILVFLREVPALGELRVVGMSQGVRYLSDGPFGQVILPGGEGLNLLLSDESVDTVSNAVSSSEPYSELQLLSEVKHIVAELSPL